MQVSPGLANVQQVQYDGTVHKNGSDYGSYDEHEESHSKKRHEEMSDWTCACGQQEVADVGCDDLKMERREDEALWRGKAGMCAAHDGGNDLHLSTHHRSL